MLFSTFTSLAMAACLSGTLATVIDRSLSGGTLTAMAVQSKDAGADECTDTERKGCKDKKKMDPHNWCDDFPFPTPWLPCGIWPKKEKCAKCNLD